jgi:hypothetical protein
VYIRHLGINAAGLVLNKASDQGRLFGRHIGLVNVCSWPGRAKAEFKLAAVKLSSKAGQQGKFRADHERPVMAESVSSRASLKADIGVQFGASKCQDFMDSV